jgi:hypothetical protein
MIQNKIHLKHLTAVIQTLIKIGCANSEMKFTDEITNMFKGILHFAFPFVCKFKMSHKMINITT